MSRSEMYPWSLLTEVGDYFTVQSSLKPYNYMNQLVAQKNYRLAGELKYVATKTSYGTIVMLAQISDELPPHEFMTQEGISASTSRRHLIDLRTENLTAAELGKRMVSPPRSQSQIIAAMHPDVRNENLPWWYDPKNGKLLVNTKRIKEPEASLWLKNEFRPHAEAPYPEHYNLGADLLIRPEPDEDEVEDWGDQTFAPGGGEITSDEDDS